MDCRKFIIILLLNLVSSITYSQIDYIVEDSIKSQGITLRMGADSENSEYVVKVLSKEEVKYYPEDIEEYGFRDGRVYVSRKIDLSTISKQVFLERLVDGEVKLYYYRGSGVKQYYIERDTSLIALDKEGVVLQQLVNDCPNITDIVKSAKYKKKWLAKTVRFYNNCNDFKPKEKDIPKPKRLGVYGGVSNAQLNKSSGFSNAFLKDATYSNSTALTLGLFYDLPISLSNFSLNVGTNISKFGFRAFKSTRNSSQYPVDIESIINITTVDVPILLRYSFSSKKFSPYLNIGYDFAYNMQYEGVIYQSIFDDDIITINRASDEKLLSKTMMGYLIGAGFNYKVNAKNTIFGEVRMSNLFGQNDTLNKSQLSILLGFSF
ncbi:outer membrane beta-barrel protein [Chondrinema litorale]|uniref:outer membrane beta-barrel protein n=1 Tax=Chondrinema litorale TaxID=2994555 RepID=UPI0025427B6E|nr:outer membrane beta-barrel protein [Chondrinema litorale]UZR99159.1 outer membrane beta-barrel protein [Chondrinema litorale]